MGTGRAKGQSRCCHQSQHLLSWQKPSSSLFTVNRELSAIEKMVWRHYVPQDPTDYQLTWPDLVMQTYSLCLLLLLALALPCSSPHSDQELSEPLCQEASFLYPCSRLLAHTGWPSWCSPSLFLCPINTLPQLISVYSLLILAKNSYQTSLSLYAKPHFKSTSRKTKHNITPHKPTLQKNGPQ